MNEILDKLLDLEIGESIYVEDLKYIRVPGGWIASEESYVYPDNYAKVNTFIPEPKEEKAK